jgi:membrane protein implicated in regulation of membrane protease activity
MAPVSRSRYIRGLIVFLFGGAALFVLWFAVSLLVEVVTGHGSSAGNILRIGLSIFLLAVSAILSIVAILNWRSSHPSEGDKTS